MSEALPTPEELFKRDHRPPKTGWMETPVDIRPGIACYAAKPNNLEYVGLPNPREWNPLEEDWKLPENWQEIVLEGLRERLDRFRSLKIFMDICVRCGACADKCHFFHRQRRPPRTCPCCGLNCCGRFNRREFTKAGKIMGKFAGARELTIDVLKEWWSYFFPMHRMPPLLGFLPLRDRHGGNHHHRPGTAEPAGPQHRLDRRHRWPTATVRATISAFSPMRTRTWLDFFTDDIEEITGVRVNPSFNRKGAEILFITPSGDVFRRPGNVYLHGLYDAFSLPGKPGAGYHLEHLCFRGGATSAFSLPMK